MAIDIEPFQGFNTNEDLLLLNHNKEDNSIGTQIAFPQLRDCLRSDVFALQNR